MGSKTGIYVHIPFCVRKCGYCDFLSFPAGEEQRERYTENLVREIKMENQIISEIKEADTIFIGGGTPSILSASQMERILGAIADRFCILPGAEITIECNPGTVLSEKLSVYRKLGINRISFGVQSASDPELKKLGRIHSFEEAVYSFRAARSAGFDNINIDLMSGIPGQTLESYKNTLKKVLAMEPEHISSYSLIVEEGTPFYELYAENPPVDEDMDREMYSYTKEKLADSGYERYEISNYARRGFECRHNLKYWSGDDYIGFGLGACSKISNIRYKNVAHMKTYLSEIQDGRPAAEIEDVLGREDEMSEFFILGLRRTKGVSLVEFEQRFSVNVFQVYGEVIKKMLRLELLICSEDRLYLSDKGIDVSNYVLSEFI